MKNSTADFESIMAMAAMENVGRRNAPLQTRKYKRYGARARTGKWERAGNLGIFLAISVFTSVVFVAGLFPGGVDAPQLWTHAFIALTVAQFAMLAGATLKASSRRGVEAIMPDLHVSDRHGSTNGIDSGVTDAPAAMLPQLPPVAISSGLMGGKAYVALSDGSVEIDTMLGRRRFVDLNAAREFVGD